MISMDKFYLIGSILFGAGVIGSAINAKIQWVALNIGGKISMVGSALFQIMLMVLFIGLYLQIRKQNKLVNNPAVDEFIKELKSKDISNNIQSKTTSEKKKDIKESIFNSNIIKKSIIKEPKIKSENNKYNY